MHNNHHKHHAADRDWDANAESYNEQIDALEPELHKATNALLAAAKIAPGMRVLDVACGPGHTTAAATNAGADALGIDSSAQMIRHASSRFPKSRFQIGDMRSPPAGPWDAVLCRLGGHHVEARWMRAVEAVLRPGGRLAIAETDAVDEAARAKNMKSPQEWARLVEEAGFVDVHVVKSEANFDRIPRSVWAFARLDNHVHEPPKGAVYVIVGAKASQR